MEVLKDFKNDLLQRREIKLIVESNTTPSYEETKSLLEKEFKAKPESTVIKTVKGTFGRKTFLVKAYAYNSKEAMENIETKTQKQRKAEAEEAEKVEAEAKAAAEKPAESSAEDKPTKEAKPTEVKEEKSDENKEKKTE